MLDFIRVAAAVPPVAVANPAQNALHCIKMAQEAEKNSPQLVVFPELCLTGYTCGDLFFQQALLTGAKAALTQVVAASKGLQAVLAVGLPLKIGGELYNCAVILHRGKVYGVVPKTYIPTYNEFYEQRWFSSALQLKRSGLTARELGLDAEQAEPLPWAPGFYLTPAAFVLVPKFARTFGPPFRQAACLL